MNYKQSKDFQLKFSDLNSKQLKNCFYFNRIHEVIITYKVCIWDGDIQIITNCYHRDNAGYPHGKNSRGKLQHFIKICFIKKIFELFKCPPTRSLI